ncbi:aminotransferase class V-fold PLP-dependent enzyme [Embleya sp. NPDC020630]|uniref:aminotransferase class V-fold PLP-dependent enzyme n=1 Tax=Embleya sp. NPDC020630 TaxID=3363979 RepID=UPI0037B06F75
MGIAEPAGPPDFEAIRRTEYGYLDDQGLVYLDHTGAGLAARRQWRAHAARMAGRTYGNPHSEHPASVASTDLVEHTRRAILAHFNADPDRYAAVFTANATGACRLVGEAYPFRRGTRFVLPIDNHNSVNGIREYARARGARTEYIGLAGPELRLDGERLRATLARRRGLFAFPAQSNFTGVRHPLEWIDVAHEHGWDVLLDAAAYAPTNVLDLAVVQPEFVAVSWYKVFGYPTGVGALIARRDALARLRRPWFAGGTIEAVSAQGGWHRMADDESAYEDGTLNFLAVPDVAQGLAWVEEVGMTAIHERVAALTAHLLAGLAELHHHGGEPLVRVYGPGTTDERGATVALNVLDAAGHVVDERVVARDTAAARICVRTGCFCNPGAGEAAFAIGRRTLRGAVLRTAASGGTLDDYLTRLGLPSGGAVRVSLGLPSTRADVDAFLDFLDRTYRDRPVDPNGLAPRLRC